MSKFIILGTQRSGTTMLMNGLDKLSSISCFGEILSEKVSNKPIEHWQEEMIEQRRKKNENCYGAWLQNNSGNLHDFLDDLFSREKHVGFKMLYEHYKKKQSELDSYFNKNKDIKFIFIYKNDVIKQAISHKLKKSKPFTEKIYVDYNWAKEKARTLVDQNKKLLEKFNYNLLKVNYERITSDEEISEIPSDVSYDILNFIEYEYPDTSIPVKLKKHWPSKLEDRITNYKEFI